MGILKNWKWISSCFHNFTFPLCFFPTAMSQWFAVAHELSLILCRDRFAISAHLFPTHLQYMIFLPFLQSIFFIQIFTMRKQNTLFAPRWTDKNSTKNDVGCTTESNTNKGFWSHFAYLFVWTHSLLYLIYTIRFINFRKISVARTLSPIHTKILSYGLHASLGLWFISTELFNK